jgi:membrane protein DedA with SNARE-associated domain
MESLILDFVNYVLEKNIFIVYVFFFISAVLQLVFPPFPSDVILVFEGYVTTVSQAFNFVPVLLNALAGTFIGSVIAYKVGFHNGSSVLEYKLIKRYIDEKHMKRAGRIFERYGSFAIIVSKFVPGVNAIMLLFSGIFKVKSKVVYSSILISSLLHHILALILGRLLGNNLSQINKVLKTYNGITIVLFIIFVSVLGTIFLIKRKKQKA